MAITQNKYIADINYYLTNANVKLDNLVEPFNDLSNNKEDNISNIGGSFLSQGIGIQGILSGSNFTLNDYNNMMIRISTTDQNYADENTAIVLNASQPTLLRINTTLYINKSQSEVLITGDYLVGFSVTVYKNNYVGPLTIRAAGRDRLGGNRVRPSYLHLAEDETIGTIHIADNFCNVENGVVGNYFLAFNKFQGAPLFQSPIGGVGLQRFYIQTWEYIGTF